ncbi:MAG: hypothetical protein GY757_03465, partial [bacterium]|nr:hypothetical protein [bacterium]
QQYYGIEFDQYAVDIMGGIQPISNLAFSFYGAFGDHIDYDNVQKAKRTLLNPGITCNMGRHVRLDLSLTYERLNVEAGRLYTATVADTSLLYQLNRRIFLRSIIQYVDYNYNVENYTFELEPRFKHLFTQFLFSYKLNPRTVLFLGYSDNYQGNQAYRLKQSDRTFFAKIGYALQL